MPRRRSHQQLDIARSTHPTFERLEGRKLLSLTPLGPEFRVNTFTPRDQGDAQIAADPEGNFVVVWASEEPLLGEGGDPDPPNDVYAQRYDASGAPQGGEFRVNLTGAGDQRMPAVAMDDQGNLVVAWGSVQDGSGFGVYARRFSADGTPLTGEIPVNSYTTSNQYGPSVAMDADGDFVVAWTSYTQDEAPAIEPGVYAQRFDSAGQPQGGEFRVNTFTPGYQRQPDVAMSAGGDFVVAWEAFEQDGSSIGIYAQRYSAAGVPQGGEFPVNTYTTDVQSAPTVAADDAGNFVVAWSSRDQDGSIDGVYARRYSAAGVPQGGEFRVNTFTTGVQRAPTVDMDADGDFVVAWQSWAQDGNEYGVFAQQYNAAGVAQGGEVPVNTFTTGLQGGPSVAVGDAGQAIVAWSSIPQDGSGWGIYAQRFAPGETPNVVGSAFLYATAPQRLRFTFNQDVGASLGLVDLIVQGGGQSFAPSMLSYDGTTNTATFTLGTVLPDGVFRATLPAAGVTNANGQPLPADHVFEFTFVRGDATGDGRVDLADFNVLALNFGLSGRDFTQGDFDYSGNVNLADFNLMANRFGTVLGPEGQLARRGTSPPPASAFGRTLLADTDAGDEQDVREQLEGGEESH